MKIFYRKEKRIPFTQEGYNKLLVEKSKYLEERPTAVDHLKKAREMGDLSENGYYKASRQRLTFLDAQIKKVSRLITLAQIVEPRHDGIINIGSTVVVKNSGVANTFTIVGGYESNPREKSISHISPLGKALLGKRKGDEVDISTPKGILRYAIIEVN